MSNELLGASHNPSIGKTIIHALTVPLFKILSTAVFFYLLGTSWKRITSPRLRHSPTGC